MNNQDRIEKRPTWAMSPLNESQKEKLMRKSKEQPFVPAGECVNVNS